MTWDRGKEMTDHKSFTIATNVQIYFCDPRSPWQHGLLHSISRAEQISRVFPRAINRFRLYWCSTAIALMRSITYVVPFLRLYVPTRRQLWPIEHGRRACADPRRSTAQA